MFSLALAVSIAAAKRIKDDENSAWINEKIPTVVRELKASDVQQGSVNCVTLAPALRGLLATALLADQTFKARLRQAYLSCENFCAANRVAMSQIRDTNTAGFDHALPVPNLSLNDEQRQQILPLFKQRLLGLINEPTQTEATLSELCDQYGLEVTCQLCYLARQEMDLTAYNDVARSTISDNTKLWFIQKSNAVLTESYTAEKLVALAQFSYWMGGEHRFEDRVRELWTFYQVNQKWDELYREYVQYIERYEAMLSIDELNVLARSWNVAITVTDQNGEQYPIYNQDLQQPLQVTLQNLHNIHWQVVVPHMTQQECNQAMRQNRKPVPQIYLHHQAQASLSTPLRSIFASKSLTASATTFETSSTVTRIGLENLSSNITHLHASEQKKNTEKKQCLQEKIEQQRQLLEQRKQEILERDDVRKFLAQEVDSLEAKITSMQKDITTVNEKLQQPLAKAISVQHIKQSARERLAVLKAKAKDLSAAKKAAAGQNIKQQQLMQEKIQQQIIEKDIKALDLRLKDKRNEKANKTTGITEKKQLITTASNNLMQYQTQLAQKKQAVAQAIQNVANSKTRIETKKAQLQQDLAAKGTVNIQVSSTTGPGSPEYAFIKVNGDAVNPPGGGRRGIMVAYIDGTTGTLVGSIKRDTHANIDGMGDIAESLENNANIAHMITALITMDEATNSKDDCKTCYNNLCSGISEIGGLNFKELNWRGRMYFVREQGRASDTIKYLRTAKGNQNNIHTPTGNFRSTTPRIKIQQAYDQDMKALEAERRQRQETKTALKNEQVALEASVSQTNSSIEQHNKHLSALESERTVLVNEIAALEEQRDTLSNDLEENLARQKNIQDGKKPVAIPNLQQAAPTETALSEQQKATLQQRREALMSEIQQLEKSLIARRTQLQEISGPHNGGSGLLVNTAVIHKDVDALRQLLETGNTANIKDEYGWTPLHCVCAYANPGNIKVSKHMIRLLIAYGADLSIPNTFDERPHDLAASNEVKDYVLAVSLGYHSRLQGAEHVEQVKFALAAGAKPHQKVALQGTSDAPSEQQQHLNDNVYPAMRWLLMSLTPSINVLEALLSYQLDITTTYEGHTALQILEQRKDTYRPEFFAAAKNLLQPGNQEPVTTPSASRQEELNS